MIIDNLTDKFGRMGARVTVEPVRNLGGWHEPAPTRINIRKDRHGEFFQLMVDPQRVAAMQVIDVRPADRHLLLMVRQRPVEILPYMLLKQKFLCGHDERAWFVAAVPESSSASNVRTAMEALKPPAVLTSQACVGLKARHWHRRKNRAFIRQGEWFFIPQPSMNFDSQLVLRNEPLQRGGSKPHWAEYCVRIGGETVYVSSLFPNGLTEAGYKRWIDSNPKRRNLLRWNRMTRNARVYVRGRIRHPDHNTVVLNGWHEVQMNTETQARAMAHVAFLD